MKRHPADLVSLIFALFFLCVLAFWFLGGVLEMSLPQPGWTMAAALIFFGVLGLVRTWRTGKRQEAAQKDQETS